MIISLIGQVPTTNGQTTRNFDIEYKLLLHYQIYDSASLTNKTLNQEYILSWRVDTLKNLDLDWFWNGEVSIITKNGNPISNTTLAVNKDMSYRQLYDQELLVYQALFDQITVEQILQLISKSLFIPPNMDEFIDRTEHDPFEMLRSIGIKSVPNIMKLDQESKSSVSSDWVSISDDNDSSLSGLGSQKYHVLVGHYKDSVVKDDETRSNYEVDVRNIVSNYYAGGMIDHFATTLFVNGSRGDSKYLADIQFQLAKLDHNYPPLPIVQLSNTGNIFLFAYENQEMVAVIGVSIIVLLVSSMMYFRSKARYDTSDSLRNMQRID